MLRIRPLRYLGLKGRGGLLLASGLILGALLTALFFFDVAQISSAYGRADAARQQRSDNVRLMLAMTREDAGLDGYAATGDPQTLNDYRAAQTDADRVFANLVSAVTDSHERSLLAELGRDRDRWDAILTLREAAPGDAALSSQGHALFREIEDDDSIIESAFTADYLAAQSDARSSTTRAQISALLGAGTGAIALLLLARLFLRSTLSPLLDLLATAERMAAGRIVRVPATERHDEVGALARALVAWDRTARRQGALERQAEETERRYQHLFQSAPIGIARTGLDGRIQEANPALGEMLGMTQRSLRGVALADLVEPAERGEVTAAYERVGSGERAVQAVLGRRTRADGSIRWLEVALSSLPSPGGRRPASLVAMFEDVTDLQRHLERLRAINQIGQTILEGRPMDEVNHAIAASAKDLVGADLSAVATRSGANLVVQAAIGRGEREYQASVIPIDDSLVGEALSSGRTVISEDVKIDPRASSAIAARLDTGALVAAPIAHDGVVVVMNRRGGRHFEPADVELLGTFASQAALAYEYERSQEHLRQLRLLEERERIAKDLQDSVIQSLFGIGLTLQAAALRAGAADVAERIDAAEAELDVTIRRMRNLVFGLMPNLDADRHLDLALRHLADDYELRSGTKVATEVDQPLAAELSAAAPALLELTRRALTPSGSFAGGDVRLRLHRVNGHGVLEIGSERSGARFEALDLPALEEAVRGIRGVVEVRPGSAESGATLQVRVPVARSNP